MTADFSALLMEVDVDADAPNDAPVPCAAARRDPFRLCDAWWWPPLPAAWDACDVWCDDEGVPECAKFPPPPAASFSSSPFAPFGEGDDACKSSCCFVVRTPALSSSFGSRKIGSMMRPCRRLQCAIKFDFAANFESQFFTEHLNGFSPVCDRMCWFKSDRSPKGSERLQPRHWHDTLQ